MTVYLDLTVLFNAAVDYLLLQGTSRLANRKESPFRLLAAAALGGVYGALCMLPGFSFMAQPHWRVVSLVLCVTLAFGFQRETVGLGCLFVLLSLALGGLALSIGANRIPEMAIACLGLWLLCRCGFSYWHRSGNLVAVQIRHGGKRLSVTALADTGNHLRDPITGEPVLVLSPKLAEKITGLSQDQLRSPLETLSSGILPGLRLIPYRTVGGKGMLLALRLEEVSIGSRRGSMLAAFAPEGFGEDGSYQALTGGQ